MGEPSIPTYWRAVPVSILGFGLVLLFLTVGEVWGVTLAGGANNPIFLPGLVTSIPAIVVIVFGGLWLRHSPLSTERYPRITGWFLFGLFFLTGFTAIIALNIVEGSWARVATVRWGASIGAGGGFLIGIFEARAINHAVVAQQVRAEELERRRELLDYLNDILRHEVLNTTQVVSGYADLLEAPRVDDDSRQEYAQYIRQEAGDLTSVTDDVKQLLETAQAGSEMEPRNLSAVCRDQLRSLGARYDEVEVETSIQDEVIVRADDLLGRLLWKLFENAVKHNDSVTPHIWVTVGSSGETATIRVRDNGPGVPETMRNDLFERTTRKDTVHGIGLSIVDLLADRYGGTVALADTGPQGSVFKVQLPRADID